MSAQTGRSWHGARWLVAAALALAALGAALWPQADVGQIRYFRDQTYHHLTLRVLNQVPYGGADTGEVLETIKHIRAGDENGWFVAWQATADRVAKLASSNRDDVSRGRALLRAHNYYRTAEFLLPPNDPRRPQVWVKNISAFYSGLDALGVTYERLMAPYGEHHLNALYFPGRPGSDTKPLIMVCGGFDSTLEELYFTVGAGAIERGYPVLLFEGPGQGAVLREQGLPFTPEWERPTRAVLDVFLASHARPPHIVLLGMSMGGYLAPRAAAFEARIDGVVAFDVLFDMAAASRASSKALGTAIAWLRGSGLDGSADTIMQLAMQVAPGFRWAVNNTMWTMQVQSLAGLTTALNTYTLRDVAKDIHGDVLILAGAEDQFVPLDQVRDFQDALTQAGSVTTAVYSAESGGKEHCQDGAVTLWQATLFDWLEAKFPSRE